MLGWLRRSAERRAIGHELFERIVAQARTPAFYSSLGVADTMEGRFEMIMLHQVLVLHRLRSEGPAGQRLGQALNEALVAAMDDALRQIGIGDMGVPRRVGKAAAALSERAVDYEAGLKANAERRDDAGALTEAISRYVPAGTPDGTLTAANAKLLGGYVAAAVLNLGEQSADELFSGRVQFPGLPIPTRDPSETHR